MGENPRPLLKDVLRPFAPGEIATIPSGLLERPVTSVTANSRDVKPGSIFVAIRGTNQDGHAFVPEALRNGATLIVGESPPTAAVPFLRVADARVALAQLAASYYQFPSLSLFVIGVTGTSGKTTTTYLIESILTASGIPTGIIGTVNIRYGNHIFPAEQTTPDAAEIQRLLSEMKAAGCKAVVMEVSSHALRQNRTAYVAFDAAVFTNLSPEHQDFHPDMEHYFKSKEFLFTQSIQQSIT
ncbi:MAG TPA: Mur ligase family protein, partial [Bdellovibrionota bacterium]|nr:Mur ligase family protein [Bdellovibrionota bacterium]